MLVAVHDTYNLQLNRSPEGVLVAVGYTKLDMLGGGLDRQVDC